MPRRNAIDVVAPAWEHMRRVLFPVRWAIWWRVAVLGFLSGEMHSSGGFNFQFPSVPQHQHKLAALPHMPGPAVLAAIAALVALGLVCLVILTYIGSVFRFILFDAVLTRRFAIGDGWQKWQRQGLRLFGFNLAMMFALLTLIAMFAVPVLLFIFKYKDRVDGHVVLLIAGGALLFTIGLAIGLVLSLIYTLVKDFVVPQMALEDLTLGDAWRRLWGLMKADAGAYAGYIGMKIVLTLGAALAMALVFLLIILILLIPGIVVGVIVGALVHAHGGVGVGLIALLVLAAIVLALLLISLLALLSGPITIFFPAYSMHFFADRYPPLAAVLYPPPPPIPPVAPDFVPA